jgi:hypothetical protein
MSNLHRRKRGFLPILKIEISGIGAKDGDHLTATMLAAEIAVFDTDTLCVW